MIGFVRRNAAIAGSVKASVPEKGRYTHARALAPSMTMPRTMRIRSDTGHEGAVKTYFVSCPEFDVAGDCHQAKPPRISSDRSVPDRISDIV